MALSAPIGDTAARALTDRARSAGLTQLSLLLSPRWRAARNRVRRLDRRGKILLGFFGALGAAFWAAIFLFFYRVLCYFLTVPDFGPVLTYKLLSMVLLTFFSILLFSNIITALSTFFLSRELERLVAAPVRAQHVLLRPLR